MFLALTYLHAPVRSRQCSNEDNSGNHTCRKCRSCQASSHSTIHFLSALACHWLKKHYTPGLAHRLPRTPKLHTHTHTHTRDGCGGGGGITYPILYPNSGQQSLFSMIMLFLNTTTTTHQQNRISHFLVAGVVAAFVVRYGLAAAVVASVRAYCGRRRYDRSLPVGLKPGSVAAIAPYCSPSSLTSWSRRS